MKLGFGLGGPEELLPKLYETARKAVDLDPNDGETHLAMGIAYANQGKTDQSLAEFNKAESLAPNSADVLVLISWSIGPMGQAKRGVELADRAVELNPNYPDWYNQALEFAYFFGQRFDDAVKYAK